MCLEISRHSWIRLVLRSSSNKVPNKSIGSSFTAMKRPRSSVRLVSQKQKNCKENQDNLEIAQIHSFLQHTEKLSCILEEVLCPVHPVPQVPNHAGHGPYVTVLVEPLELAGHRQLPWLGFTHAIPFRTT